MTLRPSKLDLTIHNLLALVVLCRNGQIAKGNRLIESHVMVFCVAVAIDLIVHHIWDILHGTQRAHAQRRVSTGSDTLSR